MIEAPKTSSAISIEGMGIVAEPVAMLRLRDPIAFPYALTSIQSEWEPNAAAMDYAMRKDRQLAIFNETPRPEDLEKTPLSADYPVFKDDRFKYCRIGILARIVKEMRLPDESRRIVVRGIKRIVMVDTFTDASGVPLVRYRGQVESEHDNLSVENLARQKSLTQMFQELISIQGGFPEDLQMAALNAPTPSRLADVLADAMSFSRAEKLALLAAPDIKIRLDYLTILMNRELETTRLGIKIQSDVQEAIGQSQREYYLREQLKSIRQELGEMSGNADVTEMTEKMQKCDLPEVVAETVKKEISRLELIPTNAPEYHIAYNYINWMLDVPWKVFSEDRLDCTEAEKILAEDHFGLEDVKSRILEFLAVMQRRQHDDRCRAPILCLVGPPGVGKTSLGRSIARAMNRKFIRVSLGGVRDEAEIRGHRRTYVGAMPGRIVQNLKRAGSANPVFMLDEVDKLAHDFRGDPASALLEVLDPEQNCAFNDNYIELPLDLSKVFFIATANVLDEIPGPLRDRMEVINIPGYTALEKREIATHYLVPRQLTENGLNEKTVRFGKTAVDEIIDYYTMEAGVRNLERTIGTVCRRITRKLISGEYSEEKKLSVDRKLVNELLGARKFLREKAVSVPRPGCAVGMAWTSVGGVILPIETVAVPGGKGVLKLTGSLGKVMQESAETAFTLVRSLAPQWKVSPEFFGDHDFHIHVPDGATPKDGPSAGITMTLALISLLRDKPLIPHLAMTGEITLQGRVTAIGGVREKLVGALRAGIKTILMPEENRKDYLELPENIKSSLDVHFVSDFKEAMKIAFKEMA